MVYEAGRGGQRMGALLGRAGRGAFSVRTNYGRLKKRNGEMTLARRLARYACVLHVRVRLRRLRGGATRGPRLRAVYRQGRCVRRHTSRRPTGRSLAHFRVHRLSDVHEGRTKALHRCRRQEKSTRHNAHNYARLQPERHLSQRHGRVHAADPKSWIDPSVTPGASCER